MWRGSIQLFLHKRKKYTCPACKDKSYFTDKEKRVDRSNEAKDRKYQKAIKRIEKAAGKDGFKHYEKAIKVVSKNLYRYGWFDSTEEIMAAIELIKKGISVKHQVKVDRYKVDFVIPDFKIILEVDGHIFHTKATRERERVRDNVLILAYGAEWEVIRVSDEMINENITKLVPALLKIRAKRRSLRKKYGGQLPYWYSDEGKTG